MPWARALICALGLLACIAARAQPVPLQGLSLLDQTAQPLRASALRGRVVLLHFVYTGCSSTCPTQLRELAALHDALPPSIRGAVRFVSVSLDPHDTPATLSAFARRLDAERPGWTYSSGRSRDLELLAQRLQAYDPAKATPGLADHRTSLFVFDADGALVQRYAGVPVDRPRLQRDFAQIVPNASNVATRRGP